MAKATSRKELRTVMKPVKEEVVTGVTLDLSFDEAQFIADVLAKVGGSPEYSRRRYGVTILDALKSAGVKFQFPIPDVDRDRGITFNDDIPGNLNSLR